MDINQDLVASVADLARLRLSPEELASTTADLRRILGHFEAIGQVDTEGVEPLAHVLTTHGQPGEDVVAPFDEARRRLTAATDHAREGFFVVPRVLDDEVPAADSGASAGSAPGADAGLGSDGDPDPAADEEELL